MTSRRKAGHKPLLRPLALAAAAGLVTGLAMVEAADGDLASLLANSRQPALAILPPMPVAITRMTPPPVVPRPAIAQAQMLYLVRSTLLALNDANRSGNYTVLRERAGPSFRERNSVADLARIFAAIRTGGLDLGAVALAKPDLAQPATIGADRQLRIKGAYRLGARRVLFDLVFEIVAGEWRLFAISIGVRPADVAAVAARSAALADRRTDPAHQSPYRP